jgi:hypothetical protein
MRDGWLFPGIVVLTIMICFTFLPLPDSQGATIDQDHFLVVHPPSFPYSGPAPLTVQWSGGAGSTWVQLLPCQRADCSDVNTTASLQPHATPRWSEIGRGGSGSFTVSVPTNGSLVLLTNAPAVLSLNVGWNEMPEFALIWTVLAVLGVLLVVTGLFLPEHGALRGHQRRDRARHYHHWRHHDFELPAHLPAHGLTCAECGLTDIPHEDDKCPRCHAALGPEMIAGHGDSLVIEDVDPRKPWKVLHGLNIPPRDTLILTREDPQVLVTTYGLADAKILRLTRAEREGGVSPKDVDAIGHMSDAFLREHPQGLVVLTDASYFVSHVSFDVFHHLVQELQDQAHTHQATFLLALNPETLKEEQITRLEERMRRLL